LSVSRISEVEALHLRLPDVPEAADGTRDVLLVEITTEDGLTGVGEASSSSFVCRAIVEAPRSAARRHGLRAILRGQDALDVEGNWQLMYEQTRRYGRRGAAIHAISAADLALWDILGKARGEPVHALLGGKQRDRVSAYASYLFQETPEATAACAREALELGLKAVKFGWGPFGADEATDLAHVDAAREALGGQADLMIDAGCAFDTRTALSRARELARRGVRWFEEPLHYDDLEGYAWLCERSPVPIAAGEMETAVADFARLIDAGVHVLQPDVAICGGLTVARAASERAYAAGRTTVAHAFSTGVCLMASLHWMASRPDGDLVEYCLAPSPFVSDLVTTRPALEDGFLTVPDTPGLGISLDRAMIDRYRVA
jgi:L-rhamnonate dehydratase